MVAEPPKPRLDGLQQEVYTVPTYSKLQPNSKRINVVLHNMSCQVVTFSRGEVVASLVAANAVPKMLAPKNPKHFYDSSESAETEENILKNSTIEVVIGQGFMNIPIHTRTQMVILMSKHQTN